MDLLEQHQLSVEAAKGLYQAAERLAGPCLHLRVCSRFSTN
jgi:hypothetical protein